MTIINKDMLFYHPILDKAYNVYNMPDSIDNLVEGSYYILGNYVYRYDGIVEDISQAESGVIVKLHNKFFVKPHPKDELIVYHVDNLVSKNRLHGDEQDTTSAKIYHKVNDIINSYIDDFEKGKNILKNHVSTAYRSSEIYVPEIKETDDILCKLIKRDILDREIIPKEEDARFGKRNFFGNLVASISGITKALSFKRFTQWCEILNIDWKITIFDNGTDKEHPLPRQLTVSNTENLVIDMEGGVLWRTKFPLHEKDNGFKRLIKCGIFLKNVNISDHKAKGRTPYYINNLRNSLKHTSEMRTDYFLSFCEILGFGYKIEIHDNVSNKDYMCTEGTK